MDNLNTHKLRALRSIRAPGEARRIRPTPRVIITRSYAWQLAESCPELAEGMAEIELSTLQQGVSGPPQSAARGGPCGESHCGARTVRAIRSKISQAWQVYHLEDARRKLQPYLP